MLRRCRRRRRRVGGVQHGDVRERIDGVSVDRAVAVVAAGVLSVPADAVVSGDPGECSQATRMPCGPSSQASCRHRPARAARATWAPPSAGMASRPPATTRMTPEPRDFMCRATAVAETNWVVTALVIGHM